MKRFLKVFVALVFLAAALGLIFVLVKPYIKDAFRDVLENLFENFSEESTSEPTALTTPSSGDTVIPPDKAISVTLRYYLQNAQNGEYIHARDEHRTVEEGKALTIHPSPIENYTVNNEKSVLSVLQAAPGDVFLLYYDCETCTVTFSGGEGAVLLEGERIQTLRKGQTPVPPRFEKAGYTLAGYDSELLPLYEDTTFTARWELAHYTLRLYTLKGSTLDSTAFVERADAPGCFETTFTLLDSLTLPLPTCPDADFLSWNTKADGSGETVTALSAGQTASLSLYAIVNRKIHSITFEAEDGGFYPALLAPAGEKIAPPKIAPENQKAGMGLNWYTDEACTQRYAFTVMPSENLTLYGKWEKDTGTGFLDWDIQTKTIDSPEDLIAFMDYIRFYDIQTLWEMEVTYASQETVLADLARAAQAWEYRGGGTMVYSTKTKSSYQDPRSRCVVFAYMDQSYRGREASLSMPATGKTAYRYLLSDTIPGRGDAYTAFYIDSLSKSYPVSTTNQLLYVVEHGYKPLPEKGSEAERIYNAARSLLNTILPQDAADYEKVLAIFDYLVLHIEYDQAMANASSSLGDTWPLYDAYYAEGVFDRQKAVCDGIAKAFSLLCNIEGIPCIEVSGNSHAWNRVKIQNNWYVVDATFGNLQINERPHSVADHGQFLISDAQKAAAGYASASYAAIRADAAFGHFAYQTVFFDNKRIDLVITSTDELAELLTYLLSLEDDLTDHSIDFLNRIEGQSFYSAYQEALRLLEQNELSLKADCYAYHANYGEVTKLIFVKAP